MTELKIAEMAVMAFQVGVSILALNLFIRWARGAAKPKPGKPYRPKPKEYVLSFLGCEPCPTGDLPSVPEIPCRPDFLRITRMAFRKRGQPAAPIADWTSQTFWTTRITATGDTKIVLTPRNSIKKVAIEPGEFTSTTDTPDGTERTIAKVARDRVSFEFENLTPEQYTALNSLFCYPIEVVMATANNVIWVYNVTATTFIGLPIYGQVVMNTPSMSAELTAQPRNFMVRFNIDNPYWYGNLTELLAPFINVL